MDSAVLDGIINKLLEVRGKPGKQVQLSEAQMRMLCVLSKEIFLKQPNLLELEAPVKICGIFPRTLCSLFLFLFLLCFMFVYVRLGRVFEFDYGCLCAVGRDRI